MSEPRPQYAYEVRSALTNIQELVDKLGLSEHCKRTAAGISVLCPHHGERTPSCSVTTGPDGTIRVKCFGCQWTADALGLIAEVRGYSTRDKDQFREVMIEGAEIAGRLQLADEIRGYVSNREANREKVEPPKPKPPPEYPRISEVVDLWETAKSIGDDSTAKSYLAGRAISVSAATERGLLRVIGFDTSRPAWAFCKGLPWFTTGHRLVTRVWSSDGVPRSVRSWQCDGRDYPKRLPPSGHAAKGLVLANKPAVELLKGKERPARVIIAEGEPDWVSVATRCRPDEAVFGIGSGFWTDDHAKRIPNATPVLILTDLDEAGNKYAEEVAKSLNNRCPLWRLSQ